jgi:hypothetical protein
MRGHKILGPSRVEKNHRIVILVDYAQAGTVVSALRSYVVKAPNSTVRIHCDDLSVFDEIDGD